MKKRLLITTTSSIDGVKIDSYEGIVSARVVTGTDFFTDLFAGFSDVFGGRSGAYQKQLKSIYEEVIDLLSIDAEKLGANVILGLKIDHDEISGKGKQMFMVTATGTAAKIKDYISEKSDMLNEVSIDHYEKVYSRLLMIQKIKKNPQSIEMNWSYLIQNNLSELMDEIFNYFINYDEFNYDETRANTTEYFTLLEHEISRKYLYDKQSNLVSKKVERLILDANLIDYDQIHKLFQKDNFSLQKCCLNLINGKKNTYYKDDIAKLEALRSIILEIYPSKPNISLDENWNCKCGKGNKAGQVYCKSCDKDSSGFEKDDKKPYQAVDDINEKIYVLRHIFKNQIMPLINQ